MHATFNADCPPQRLRFPESVKPARLQEEIDRLRSARIEMENRWFDLPLELRESARQMVREVNAAIKRPSPWLIIQVVGRFAWHMALNDESYFQAVRDYVREADRFFEIIRTKSIQEDELHQRLFSEADAEAVSGSQGFTELRKGNLIAGSVEELRRRREARQSKATG